MEEIRNKRKFEFENDDYKEIDINSILNIFLRNKKVISITSLAGTLLGIIYSLIQNPIYIGRFQVVVDTKGEQKISSQSQSISGLISGEISNTLKTQELILNSPSVLKPVYKYAKAKYAERNDPKQNWSFSKWSATTLDISFSKGTNVLNIAFKDNETTLILSTLEKIISQYQNYSKLSRDKNLTRGFNFLTNQQKILKEKSLQSLKELNEFSIDNGLGDIDGFVNLGSRSRIESSKEFDQLMRTSNIKRVNKDRTKAGQRFDNQFKLLEKYEAEYVDYSSVLKPNSVLLRNLKNKIETLKEALKRPNEILVKYKELSNIAERDEVILNQVEDDLAFTKLEIARQKDPWEMIFEPTIDDIRISPKRSKITILSFFASLSIGLILAFIKDKSSGMVYELTDLKRLINCELIDCIELSNKDLSKKIVYNFIDSKTKYDLKTALTKTYFINTFNGQTNGSNNLANNLFEDKKNPIITLDDTNQIDKSEYLIFFINKNNITKKDINLINKYISLYSSKVLGWYFLQNT